MRREIAKELKHPDLSEKERAALVAEQESCVADLTAAERKLERLSRKEEYLRKDKEQLRTKKAQLRNKEEQLRKKEERLQQDGADKKKKLSPYEIMDKVYKDATYTAPVRVHGDHKPVTLEEKKKS
eukprot:XP_001702645.1 predicted protein [Chlamydomonas reinhardtii]